MVETTRDLLVFSLTINFFVLVDAITKRVFNDQLRSRKGWVTLPGNIQENEQNFRRFGYRMSKSAVRALVSIVQLGMGLYLILESRITTHPFEVTDSVMSNAFAIQLAFYTFEFLVPFLDRKKPFSGYSEILHHAVSMTMYLSIIVTKENALLGLIGLFTSADFFMDEVISLFQYFPYRKKTLTYTICLFLSSVSLGTFRIILPIVTFSVTMAYSAPQVNSMLSISIGIFFFSVVFLLSYNLWFYVTKMHYLYVEFKKVVPVRDVKKSVSLEKQNPQQKSVPNPYVFDMSGRKVASERKLFTFSNQAQATSEYEMTHYYI